MKKEEQYFRSVIAENKNLIERICRCYIVDHDLRQDLYQEILVNIWKSLKTFRGDSKLSTWIYRISTNTALYHASKEKRRKKISVFKDDAINLFSEEDSYQKKLGAQEDIELLYKAINQLPSSDKIIISLVLEDVEYNEISEITGLTLNNIRVKVSRIKKKLNQLLNP